MDSTNPGLVTVANEAFGKGLPENQAIIVGPAQSFPLNSKDGDIGGDGRLSVDQPVEVTTPGPSLRSVNGGDFEPGNGQVTNTTQNNIAGQIYGQGTPKNVFV